jgi:glycosyltransferase involved in cell wall biosynthesis
VPPFGARRDLLFIGGFRHAPNEDAVRFFVDDVLPLVRRELPDVKFLIVGSHAPAAIHRLESEHVRVLGFVKDVVPVFDACRMTVAPIRFGAGVKGKVTQSLAWGVPAVITPVAAEGLRLVDRVHLMIAAEPEEFARRVIELYRDETTWNRLSDAGRRHVDAHLSHNAVRASIEALLEQVGPAFSP